MSTEFQKQVWEQLSKIPKGRVATYAGIARAIGKPKAVRAVGTACGRNPQLVSVPCHRVVSTSARVGNYVQGAEKKTELLESEGVSVLDGVVQDFDKVCMKW